VHSFRLFSDSEPLAVDRLRCSLDAPIVLRCAAACCSVEARCRVSLSSAARSTNSKEAQVCETCHPHKRVLSHLNGWDKGEAFTQAHAVRNSPRNIHADNAPALAVTGPSGTELQAKCPERYLPNRLPP